jgi:pimeloyl-ACP methyl ester carboxylesterase
VTQVVDAPDKRKLSVESIGAPDGKPVLLLHGTPGGRNGPRPRGIFLYRLGIRLISYDRPGYPGSTRKPERTVADAAADVQAIADHLRIDRFSVVGRSGGAPHALACAALLNDRVICSAALGSLAPYDAEGLDWKAGMTGSNVRAYADAKSDLDALEAKLNSQARLVENNTDGLLKILWPELVGPDKEVVGDIAIRQLIARVHAEALSGTADGWIDDVKALSRPWNFDLSDITAPVKLWSGSEDVFSPVGHTYWLGEHIKGAEVDVEDEKGHFDAVETLPRILTWVAGKMDEER